MGKLSFTTAQINKALSYVISPISEDIVDGTNNVSNKLAVTAGVEYRLSIGTPTRHKKNGFNSNTGITKIYDIDLDKSVYNEFADTENIEAFPNCIFQPGAASSGECIIRCYVDETVPIFHDQAIVSYKGTTPEKMGDNFTFYLGSETGYDLKNKGVYFTFQFDHNGHIWDKALYQHL